MNVENIKAPATIKFESERIRAQRLFEVKSLFEARYIQHTVCGQISEQVVSDLTKEQSIDTGRNMSYSKAWC